MGRLQGNRSHCPSVGVAPSFGEAMAPTTLGHRLMEPVNAEIMFIGLVSVAETVIQLVVSAGC